MEGEITPASLNPPRFRLVTLSRLRLHVTPIQVQTGEELFHEAKTSRLFTAAWDLNSSKAFMSVSFEILA